MGPIAAEGCDIWLLRVVIFYYIKKKKVGWREEVGRYEKPADVTGTKTSARSSPHNAEEKPLWEEKRDTDPTGGWRARALVPRHNRQFNPHSHYSREDFSNLHRPGGRPGRARGQGLGPLVVLTRG